MSEAVTITEKITFTDGHEINRTMPIILNNNGGSGSGSGGLRTHFSLNTWNTFCDECDEALRPLKKVKAGLTILWFLIIICLILMGSGWLWGNDLSRYYGIIAPITVVTFILMCKFESYMKQKVQSKLMRICADISNHDTNLKMTLTSPIDKECSKNWYITVLISNTNTNYDDIDIEGTHPPIIVAAVAVPVNATAALSSTVPVPVPVSSTPTTEAPKKYIKDEENPGALTLNPEYKVWMKANGN